jgi:hypothetical protein
MAMDHYLLTVLCIFGFILAYLYGKYNELKDRFC